ncbi:MAG: ThuA domain-containing protein [Sedimentisphaerales bacterium]|nr:ThuA domain-containing protein [Sedimentisphaerales bacterium]
MSCQSMFKGLFLMSAFFLCSCEIWPKPVECPCHNTVSVAVVTGGHDFERDPFWKMFDSFDGILYLSAEQRDQSEIFEDISKWPYDVIVLYNMTQEISEQRRENFKKLLDKGVGLVALHHSIASFQEWPEYRKIIGGRYYLKDTVENGVLYKPGSYQHDLDLNIKVANRQHPITLGLEDFVIHDESYKGSAFESSNEVLLTTNHPTSDEPVCWVSNYGKSRICYIQLGHGPEAYGNENYRQLVKQAIKWAGCVDE